MGSQQPLQQLPACGSWSPNKQQILGRLHVAAAVERCRKRHHGLPAAKSTLLPAAPGSNLLFTGIPSHQFPYNVRNATERFTRISTSHPTEWPSTEQIVSVRFRSQPPAPPTSARRRNGAAVARIPRSLSSGPQSRLLLPPPP